MEEITRYLILAVKVTAAMTAIGAVGYLIVGVIWFGLLK